MDDIDLLAAPDHLPLLRAALLDLGFRHPDRHVDLAERDGLMLDLHDDVVNSGRVTLRRFGGWMAAASIWEDRCQIEAEGVRLPSMSHRDMALYTSLHALRHGYSRLTWFVDLALLLRGEEEVEWEPLLERAREFRLERPLQYCLHSLSRLPEFAPAEPVREWIESFQLTRLEELVLSRALRDRGAGEWGDLLWSFNVSGIWRRSLFLLQTAFPGPEVLLQVFPFLPRPLAVLAYALRVAPAPLPGRRAAERSAAALEVIPCRWTARPAGERRT